MNKEISKFVATTQLYAAEQTKYGRICLLASRIRIRTSCTIKICRIILIRIL